MLHLEPTYSKQPWSHTHYIMNIIKISILFNNNPVCDFNDDLGYAYNNNPAYDYNNNSINDYDNTPANDYVI